MDEERPLSYLPLETILNGKYIVGKVLGQGGFGITYLAYDLNLEVPVAIKEYFPTGMLTRSINGFDAVPLANKREVFEQGLNQFLTEAQILAQFKNIQNVVGVLNSFREYGTAYYVMDYIEGDSVKDIVKQNGVYRYDSAIKLLLPVIDALGKVHAQGVYHRDISPDNIFVTHDGTPKLLDFGAALISSDEASVKKEAVLKPGYAPKEQYRKNEAQGAWTDIYAMAATLYYMVTGQKPLDSLDRVSKDELIYPSQVGAASPAIFDVVLKKALTVEASGRYQSMEEFSSVLQAVLDGDVKTITKEQKKKFPLIPVVIAGTAVVAAAVVAIVLFAGGGNAPDRAGSQAAEAGALQGTVAPKEAFDLTVNIKKTTVEIKDEIYDSIIYITPYFKTSNADLYDLLNDEITARAKPDLEGDYGPFQGFVMQSMDENFVQAIHFYNGGGTAGTENSTVCIDVANLKRILWTDLFAPSDLTKVKMKINKDTADLLNSLTDSNQYSTTNDYYDENAAFLINSEGITFLLDRQTLKYAFDTGIGGTVMIKFPWDYLGVDITYPRDKLPQKTELDFNVGKKEPSIQDYTYGEYDKYIKSIPETELHATAPASTLPNANKAY